MKKRSKRYEERAKLVEVGKVYSLENAVKVIKQFPKAKFDESIEISIQLGVDPAKAEENLRGTVSLPHGTGKSVKVLCICKGEEAKAAQTAGADYIGTDEYMTKIQEGWLDFDVIVAHPDMMRELSKLGRVLGPKGLMPSPKAGTVVMDVAKAVKEIKKGKIEFKSDKTGGLHVACGKMSFSEQAIIENAKSVVRSLVDHRPSSVKGEFLKSVCIATSQGPGMKLETGSLLS
ncbi:MAG: 50S ribosomal protein L1 [Candidatus Omnitrophica bacterium]|nr:50S ribosomal protein L1 [Candidatus Omnitrophota bacterium]